MYLLCKISNPHSIIFHIVGLICISWFLCRVLPKPDRVVYPCQQLSLTIASTYVVFWIIIWNALFHGIALWIKRVRVKTATISPIILVSLILIFSLSSGVFANNGKTQDGSWVPIPNEPIGTPRGVNPGRVVWVWNPDASQSDLHGFWWRKQNNNQEVLDQMFSDGIQGLAGVGDDKEAWNAIFKHFNQDHGYEDRGYQPGEKIAIKVNLNNCYQLISYLKYDNDRDASPYVVKALLHQLVDVVGVAQEDITIYDASRVMGNWFYKRVYYKTFPSTTLIPEFPDIHYVDSKGATLGRQKVKPSTEHIYFADGTGITKTLPNCVVDAEYLINMPLLKRHPIQMGVTLSAKNFFGTWIEPVYDIHDYHTGAFIPDNPAPQTDLLAHEQIGGKTLLYVGDGIFGTKADHCTIAKFTMYPFNNDWTNSLFFSQDPVAIDSVMYDFLHAEGANPCEGSQNYLHQSAVPPIGVYDPENDGSYVSESLGVHEHWNTSVDIFLSDRYLGPSSNGIDFVAVGEEYAHPDVIFTNPQENHLYINGNKKCRFPVTLIIGDITIEAQVNGISDDIEKIEFYMDEELLFVDTEVPYNWTWQNKPRYKHTIKTIAHYGEEDTLSNEIVVWKFL
jgi:hypothetical protein